MFVFLFKEYTNKNVDNFFVYVYPGIAKRPIILNE